MTFLDVRDVALAFDGVPVLVGAAIAVERGEVVALLGPSGSGKSTLLRVIAGIVTPDDGTVLLDGTDISSLPTHRRGVGMVFQDNQLFPHRSTIDNVAFGLKMQGVGRRERHASAAAWLERVGLAGMGARTVTELSGGEAKRVALARTLATGPSVVLLDEPLTGLDRELHDRLASDLHGLLRAHDITAVLVTHDRNEADMIADRQMSMREVDRR